MPESAVLDTGKKKMVYVERMQGMFDGELIKWSETAYLKGDNVVLFGLYVARFKADNEMSGDWMDPKHTIRPQGPRFGTPGASFTLKKQ